jgi:tagatose-1,6-bisphosphate aldolase
MAIWARFKDGVEVEDCIFRALADAAPNGLLDVFASDQHNSYLKLIGSFFKHVGEGRQASDDDMVEACRRFARALGGRSTACLFNHLVFRSPGFRDLLGQKVLLIGRLEDTDTIPTDDGRGQLSQLAIEPELCADQVDGFKTLCKLDPDHRESWERNLEWVHDVFQRCWKLGKPLFNETLIFQRSGESKVEMARRLPEALVKMAEAFSPYGHFYKTQAPFLWVEQDGQVVRASDPREVRQVGEAMAAVVKRPMLLLSAAVDFEQYAAQYALVADLFAGPMCGRAYFKEVFTDPATRDWDTLEQSFARIALPRLEQIKGLAGVVSPPWWHQFHWMSEEAKKAISPEARAASIGVKAEPQISQIAQIF